MPGSILKVYGKFKKDTTKTLGMSKKIVSIGNGDKQLLSPNFFNCGEFLRAS